MAAESLGFYRLVGDRGGESILVTLIAYCDVHLEHYEDARIHLTRAFSMIGEVQDRRSGASALHVAGNLLAGEGRYQPAVRVLGACDALRESIGSGVSKWDEEDQDRILKRCRERLGPSFETSWAEGRSLSFEEAIREAREAIQSPV
jgi:uncharacterized SAM-binding protein YcdF (DUF218 family)